MTPFKVLTEFRFDVGHAVANSNALQSEVGKLSSAADEALLSFKRLGFGIVAQMGLGGTGIIGLFGGALQASDKFAASQRKLSNILLSNNAMVGDQAATFGQAMAHSEKVLNRIVGKAQEFALDPNALLDQASSIAPMLISHGLDNADLSKSIDIARGLLKSAPTLGIEPGLMGGQLINLVMGQADGNNTLFQRLMSETAPFKDAGIKNSKGYNALDGPKRIELLRKALLQFGSNADVLRGNMMSLNGQMQVFSSLVKGQFSIFRRLGDVLSNPIRQILFNVNKFLASDGRKIVDSFSRILNDIIKDPKKLLINLMQLRDLQSDVKSSGNILGIIAALQLLGFGAKALGVNIGLLGAGIGRLALWVGGIFLTGIKIALPWLVKFGVFMLRFVLAPLMALTFFFQIISRAIAKAKISNAEWMLNNMAKIMELFEQFKMALDMILLPITLAIEFWSDLLSWMFRLDVSGNALLGIFGLIADVMGKVGTVIVHALASISAAISAAMQMAILLKNRDFTNFWGRTNEAWDDGYNQFASKYMKMPAVPDAEAPSSMRITSIGKVEINNQFKEQMEPDRIAFTLKEQIMKAALNPQQATGRTLRGAVVGP